MNKMDPRDVAAIADLARLECDEQTLTTFARQLDEILTYMDKLNQLDTSDVQPMYSPVRHETAFRQDKVSQTYSREELLENAPQEDGRYFIVPKVF
jgi:aspartyl-tRNA(Asn)/glutamyl-tRNA(Gln) amidotransferase subunit C